MKPSFLRLLLSAMLLGSGVLAVAAPPGWWTNGNPPVIDPAAAANHKGPANIGQAKWMAKNALEALRTVDPDCAAAVEADLVGPGKVIPDWNAPVTGEEKAAQHAPLLIGQLKAVSAPFYDHLHSLAPDWLANERVLNGTSNEGTHYPWTTTVADDANKAVANIGQLKAVFSLRFETLPARSTGYDEWVIAQFGEEAATGPDDDPDGDGVSNLEEFNNGLIPYHSITRMYGLPLRIKSVSLPDGTSSQFQSTGRIRYEDVVKYLEPLSTTVTDADGGETVYSFENESAEVVDVDQSVTSINKQWLVYYRTMKIHHGGGLNSPGYLGTEEYEFDHTSGFCLKRTKDFSGNETKWEYSDVYEALPKGLSESLQTMTRWSDPTSKLDALDRRESYGCRVSETW